MDQIDHHQASIQDTRRKFHGASPDPRQSPYFQRLQRKVVLEQTAMALLAATLLMAIL